MHIVNISFRTCSREDPDREEDDLLLRAAERGWPRHMGPCGLPGCMMLAMRAGLARFPPVSSSGPLHPSTHSSLAVIAKISDACGGALHEGRSLLICGPSGAQWYQTKDSALKEDLWLHQGTCLDLSFKSMSTCL